MPSPVLERQVKVQSTPHTFLRRKKSPVPFFLFLRRPSLGEPLFLFCLRQRFCWCRVEAWILCTARSARRRYCDESQRSDANERRHAPQLRHVERGRRHHEYGPHPASARG